MDDNGKFHGFYVQATDITQLRAARFRGLGEPYGLILLDVDDFKTINDHYGHEIGDRVLGALAAIIVK